MKIQPAPKRARINVKLAADSTNEQAHTLLSSTPGFQAAIQLFPDEPDESMRRMYMLEVSPDHVDAAVEQLLNNPAVESAHETAPRKLIR